MPLSLCFFMFCFASWALAQSQSSWRLTTTPPLLHSDQRPLLSRAGECVAWRSNSSFLLLDDKGKGVAEIKGLFPKHAVSSNGNSIAVLEKISKSADSDDENALAVRWLNREGRELNRYNFSQHSDDPLPQLIFNATGSHLLIVHPATAQLTFLNNNGQVLHEATLFADAPYTNERALFLVASNEAFFVLSQAAPSTSTKVVTPMLVCFSISGEEQWRRELPGGTAGNLVISEDGNWIAASRYLVDGTRVESGMAIFNRDGVLQTNLDGLFRRAVFAKDGRSLVLMDRRQLRALSLPKGELQWQINLPQRSEMFVDIAASAEQNQIFALVGTSVFKEKRFVFENARILGFNDGGQQQVETSIPTALSSPSLVISDDGQRLSLAAEGFLQNFIVSNLSK